MIKIPTMPEEFDRPTMILGSILGSGGATKTKTNEAFDQESETSSTQQDLGDQASGSVSQTLLPSWLEQFTRENIDLTRDVASRPYEAYGGQRVAPFTGDQTTGFDMTRANAGAWRPYFDTAGGVAGDLSDRSVGRWPDADVAAYMDPYLKSVMADALSEVNRQSGIDRTNIRGSLAQDDAYGGSATGIELAEQGRNTEQLRNQLINQLLSQGYSDAAARYYADEELSVRNDQLRLAGGAMSADLGRAASTLGYADAAAYLDIGQMQQDLEQSKLDTAYEDFLRQFQYPIEMLKLRMGAAGGTPYGTTTLNESLSRNVGNQVGNTLTNASGTASGTTKGIGTGGGGLTSFLGSAGSIIGGLGEAGVFSSSRELKADLGDAEETILERVKALPIRGWQYLPETGLDQAVHVGPMAEDWQEAFGLGDGKTISLIDTAGISLAAIKEMAKRLDRLEN